jgi:hypothetical protein
MSWWSSLVGTRKNVTNTVYDFIIFAVLVPIRIADVEFLPVCLLHVRESIFGFRAKAKDRNRSRLSASLTAD